MRVALARAEVAASYVVSGQSGVADAVILGVVESVRIGFAHYGFACELFRDPELCAGCGRLVDPATLGEKRVCRTCQGRER